MVQDYITLTELETTQPTVAQQIKHRIRMGMLQPDRLTHLPGRPYAIPKDVLQEFDIASAYSDEDTDEKVTWKADIAIRLLDLVQQLIV